MANDLNPQLEVITGCMFSGKSEELIRRLERAKIAGLSLCIVKPKKDTRTALTIASRCGQELFAYEIAKARDILELIDEETDVIGIDEGHFFDEELIQVCEFLLEKGKRVIISGLDLDYQGQPFEVMMELMARAYPVTKLTAICMACKSSVALRSKRLIDGEGREFIGDNEYEPRCLACFYK